MNCRAIRHTLFAAGMVFVSSTFAGTEVIKCTDGSGHVTLTDQPCKAGAAQVLLTAAAPAAASGEASEAVLHETSRYQLSNLPPAPRMRAAPHTQVQAPGRALAQDVATLKEARRTLMLLDSTMSASRQSGIAANP